MSAKHETVITFKQTFFFVGRERKISSRQKLKDIKFKFQATLNSGARRADSTELVKRYRQFKTPKQR